MSAEAVKLAHALYWTALLANGGAMLLFGVGTIFRKERLLKSGARVVLLGLAILTISLADRWAIVGHGPYLGLYEAMGSYAWAAAAAYVLAQRKFVQIRPTGLLITPAVFLMLGAGVLSSSAPQFESPAMRSLWLWIHVGLAKIALASFLLATGASIVYLRKRSAARGVYTAESHRDTNPQTGLLGLEELSVKLASLGFFFLAIVIGAGALWANTAWGAYWSWDPIETWAMATWILYGIAIHLNRLWRVSGPQWAWLNFGVLISSGVLFLIMRLLTLSPHWIYLD